MIEMCLIKVSVIDAGADEDSAWDQKKLQVGRTLVTGVESSAFSAPYREGRHPLLKSK